MGWFNFGWLGKKASEGEKTNLLDKYKKPSQTKGTDSLFVSGIKKLFAGSDFITGSNAVTQTFSGLLLNFLYFAQTFDEFIFEPALELEDTDKLFIGFSLPAIISAIAASILTSIGSVVCHTVLNKQFQEEPESLEEDLSTLVKSILNKVAPAEQPSIENGEQPVLEDKKIKDLLSAEMKKIFEPNSVLSEEEKKIKIRFDHILTKSTAHQHAKPQKIGAAYKFFLAGDAMEHIAEYSEVPIIFAKIILESMNQSLSYGASWGVFLAGTAYGIWGSLAEIRNCFRAILSSEVQPHQCSHHH